MPTVAVQAHVQQLTAVHLMATRAIIDRGFLNVTYSPPHPAWGTCLCCVSTEDPHGTHVPYEAPSVQLKVFMTQSELLHTKVEHWEDVGFCRASRSSPLHHKVIVKNQDQFCSENISPLTECGPKEM